MLRCFSIVFFAANVLTPMVNGDELFRETIRPLLAERCASCHGGVKAAGGLSFVAEDKAITEGESGLPSIVPGDPEASELLRRVTSREDSERMPPPEHGEALNDQQIEAVRQWIADGAEWDLPWSLQPLRPKTPPLAPETSGDTFESPDAYLLTSPDGDPRKFAPEAEPREWLRRVSFDLIGLPPTIEDYEHLAKAWTIDADLARSQAVDRLLASPHFGERWAAVWLDLARYADTYGYEKDGGRTIWPWRDWVINAFNADMPYDQFTIEQLAGDLLPETTADQILATAFHRNAQNNTEGGTDDEEFRMAAVIDRVDTTWTAWQGTTFGCVRCHSHPYDPYEHADYYRVLSLFNTTIDVDQNDDFPTLPIPSDSHQQQAAWEAWRDHDQSQAAYNAAGLERVRQVDDWQLLTAEHIETSGGTLEQKDAHEFHAGGTLPIGVKYTLRLPALKPWTAVRLDILPESDDPAHPPERGAVLSHITATAIDAAGQRQPLQFAAAIADHRGDYYDADASFDADAAGFGGYPVMTTARWCVFVLKDFPENAQSVELQLTQSAASNSGQQAATLRRFTLSASGDGVLRNWATGDEASQLQQRIAAAEKTLKAFNAPKVPVLISQPEAAQRETRIAIRGNRLDLGEAVQSGLPEIFVRHGAKCVDRLTFARWLVSADNPLAARTLANRLWEQVFGRGLAVTLEDLGSSGVRPTHPELLDHLAWQLANEDQWSIKRFLRRLVLSRAYAQTAAVPAEAWQADPLNERYMRGPRKRLTAEMVRDQALAISGQFVAQLHGAPVYPPQPEGVWRSVYNNERWQTSEGANRFRRAVYTFRKRTSGYPMAMLFDAPAGDVCTARRIDTNTPLQALATLNDEAIMELSEALAKRMQDAAPENVDDAIAAGYRRLFLADPDAETLGRLVALYEALAVEGQATSAADQSRQIDLPRLTLVANTLLNLDAALTR